MQRTKVSRGQYARAPTMPERKRRIGATSATRANSLIHPGIHEPYAAALEIVGISRGQRRTMHSGDGSNLGVELGNGSPDFAS